MENSCEYCRGVSHYTNGFPTSLLRSGTVARYRVEGTVPPSGKPGGFRYLPARSVPWPSLVTRPLNHYSGHQSISHSCEDRPCCASFISVRHAPDNGVGTGARWPSSLPIPSSTPRSIAPPSRTNHPVVFVDEVDYNFHTADGRYKPFADLIKNDGYYGRLKQGEVSRPGDSQELRNPRGGRTLQGTADVRTPQAAKPCVRPCRMRCPPSDRIQARWGSLLLIADHYPAIREMNE